MNNENAPDNESVTLNIDFQQPPGVPTRFATHVVIQMTGHEYILSFYEIKTPVVLGDDKAQLDQLRELESIPAEYVARIAVPPERFHEMLRVLNNYTLDFIRKAEKVGSISPAKSSSKKGRRK